MRCHNDTFHNTAMSSRKWLAGFTGGKGGWWMLHTSLIPRFLTNLQSDVSSVFDNKLCALQFLAFLCHKNECFNDFSIKNNKNTTKKITNPLLRISLIPHLQHSTFATKFEHTIMDNFNFCHSQPLALRLRAFHKKIKISNNFGLKWTQTH